jgi:peptide/nickel transport system substrate-binding protein
VSDTDLSESNLEGHVLSRRGLLVAGAGTAAALGLAACGGKSSGASTGGTPATGPAKRGGTLRVAFIGGAELDTLNPINSYLDLPNALATSMFDNLVRTKPDGTAEFALAESFEPNEDATVWTVKLRPGIKWHDGKPLTADDVIYSLRYAGRPDSASAAAYLVRRIDLKNLKKLDQLTVRIPLTTAIASLPNWLALPYGMVIIQQGATDFAHPIGTGPFKFVKWTKGRSATLVRNPDYWESGRPYLDGLSFVELPDSTARVNAILSNQVDAISAMPYATAKQYESGNAQVKLLNAKSHGIVPITMAVDVAPFDDVRVRQAFRLIADRDALVNGALSGFGRPSNDVFGVGLPFYDSSLPQRHQDIEQAKSLLKQAGREGLTVTLNTGDAAAGMVQSATIFAQQAKQAGVDVRLNERPADTYFTPPYLKWGLGQDYWQGQPLAVQWAGSLVTGAPFNTTHWNRPEWDKLFYDALADLNDSTAEAKWNSLQKTLWDEGGFLMWGTVNWVDGLSPKVQGAEPSVVQNLSNFQFKDWWIS